MSNRFILVVTGPAGNIGSNLIFQLVSQNIFGGDKKVILRLIDLPQVRERLEGLKMELEDCLYSFLEKVEIWEEKKEAFENADCVVFLSGKPRQIGMDRKELLETNASLFKKFGIMCNETAKENTKYLIVANPCNTNALVFSQFAPKIAKSKITALSALDHMRATYGVAKNLNVNTTSLKNIIVYGNHSTSLYVDVSEGKLLTIEENTNQKQERNLIISSEFAEETLQKFVHERPNHIFEKKGLTSSYSASQAVVNHLKWWYLGCSDQLVSMAVYVDRMNNENVETWVSMPVICKNAEYEVSNPGLANKSESQIRKIMMSVHSLVEEKECAKRHFETEK